MLPCEHLTLFKRLFSPITHLHYAHSAYNFHLCTYCCCCCQSDKSDELGITEGVDRVKILQQLTTMRADLIPSRATSPVKRVQSPSKTRRYSEISKPTNNRFHGRITRQSVSSGTCTLEKAIPPVVQRRTPIRELSPEKTQRESSRSSGDPVGSSQSSLSRLSSTGRTSSDSPESSRISSPTKSRGSASPHHFLEGGSSGNKEKELKLCGNVPLRGDPTLRRHNRKRLSRSLDGLLLVCEIMSLIYIVV